MKKIILPVLVLLAALGYAWQFRKAMDLRRRQREAVDKIEARVASDLAMEQRPPKPPPSPYRHLSLWDDAGRVCLVNLPSGMTVILESGSTLPSRAFELNEDTGVLREIGPLTAPYGRPSAFPLSNSTVLVWDDEDPSFEEGLEDQPPAGDAPAFVLTSKPLECFNPSTGRSEAFPAPTSAHHRGFGSVLADDHLWLVGGIRAFGHGLNDTEEGGQPAGVESLDVGTRLWKSHPGMITPPFIRAVFPDPMHPARLVLWRGPAQGLEASGETILAPALADFAGETITLASHLPWVGTQGRVWPLADGRFLRWEKGGSGRPDDLLMHRSLPDETGVSLLHGGRLEGLSSFRPADLQAVYGMGPKSVVFSMRSGHTLRLFHMDLVLRKAVELSSKGSVGTPVIGAIWVGRDQRLRAIVSDNTTFAKAALWLWSMKDGLQQKRIIKPGEREALLAAGFAVKDGVD